MLSEYKNLVDSTPADRKRPAEALMHFFIDANSFSLNKKTKDALDAKKKKGDWEVCFT